MLDIEHEASASRKEKFGDSGRGLADFTAALITPLREQDAQLRRSQFADRGDSSGA
ncbi:MAG: hypothetical protein WBE89_06930 [Methyloceanibacter sp.]